MNSVLGILSNLKRLSCSILREFGHLKHSVKMVYGVVGGILTTCTYWIHVWL